MKRKGLLSLVLAPMIMVTLVACDGKPSSVVSSTTTTPPPASSVVTPTTPTPVETVDKISDANSTAGTYTVKGVVVAKNSQGSALVRDASGYVTVFKATKDCAIGDYIQVKGTTVLRFGATTNKIKDQYQFGETAVVTKLTDKAPTLADDPAVVMTGAQYDAWDGTIGKHVKLTLTLSVSGKFLNFTVEGATKTGAFAYPEDSYGLIAANDKKTYEVEGYLIEAQTDTRNCMMVTAAKEVKPEEPEIKNEYSAVADATVDQIVAKTESELRNLYKVTGIIENITDATKGGFTLTDAATGKSFKVLALGAADLFTTVPEAGKEPTYPETFGTLNLSAGDKLTMVGYVKVQYPSAPVTMVGYHVSHVAKSEIKYPVSVTVETQDAGTAVADKTEAVYGETITVTLTPATGKMVDYVKNNGNMVVPNENTVTLAAGIKNVITVGFKDFVDIAFTSTKYTISEDVAGVNQGSTGATTAITAADLLPILLASADENSANVIASVETATSVAYKENCPLKFGSGSKIGELTLNLTENVTTITIRAIAWKAKIAQLVVVGEGTDNSVTKDIVVGDDAGTGYADYVFTIAASKTITIKTIYEKGVTDPRVIISNFTLAA